MPKRLASIWGWEALAVFSLMGYMAIPLHLAIVLGCAVTFSWPAVFLGGATLGTLLLPPKPLMWGPFLEFGFLKSIRQYFDFSVTVESPAALEQRAIWAEYPHGVYPLSQLLAVSLNPKRWPGLRVHSVGASVLFRVPLWRHFLGWLGVRPATRRSFTRLLQEKGSVKVNPGGIAEMFLLDKEREVIKIRERKGFVRIAVEHGIPLLPVWHYGNSSMLHFGPKFMEDVSRRCRMSLGFIFGRCGLPLPFKVKLHMVVGDLVPVRCLPRHHPEFEQAVDEAHAAYMEALSELYYRHREDDRPLVMV